MGSGMGWDCSVGALCVFGGDNHFEAANSLVQGCGAQGSLGILYQYGDDSEFKGYGQGYASSNLTYHNPSDCGGNFSFLVSYGTGNKFGCGAQEHSIIQRGTAGGFLISRPRHDQVDADCQSSRRKNHGRAVSAGKDEVSTRWTDSCKRGGTSQSLRKGANSSRQPTPFAAHVRRDHRRCLVMSAHGCEHFRQ